jgi:hypothetical protein
MKNQYSIISLAIQLALFISSVSAQTMYIKQKGGEKLSYDINNVGKMTFSAGNLNVVKVDASNDAYALANLQFVSFGDFQTAIQPVHSFRNELSIFPNPVNYILNIKNLPSEASTIVITSLEGKLMLSKKLNPLENAGVDVSQLSTGFYICKLYNGTNVLTTKFLKQ